MLDPGRRFTLMVQHVILSSAYKKCKPVVGDLVYVVVDAYQFFIHLGLVSGVAGEPPWAVSAPDLAMSAWARV